MTTTTDQGKLDVIWS